MHSHREGVQAMSENTRICVSVAEAARLLGVSRPTMYKIIQSDDCQIAFKCGARTLVDVSALREWSSKQVRAGDANGRI